MPLASSGDERFIDRFGPNGIAFVAQKIAVRAAALQSGYLYHYAFAMVTGVAALITWYWFKG